MNLKSYAYAGWLRLLRELGFPLTPGTFAALATGVLKASEGSVADISVMIRAAEGDYAMQFELIDEPNELTLSMLRQLGGDQDGKVLTVRANAEALMLAKALSLLAAINYGSDLVPMAVPEESTASLILDEIFDQAENHA